MPICSSVSPSLQQILAESFLPLCSPAPWSFQRRKGKKGTAFLFMCQIYTDVYMTELCCFILGCRIKRHGITSGSTDSVLFQDCVTYSQSPLKMIGGSCLLVVQKNIEFFFKKKIKFLLKTGTWIQCVSTICIKCTKYEN